MRLSRSIKVIMWHWGIDQTQGPMSGVKGLLITHLPSTSSVPSVRTSFVKFEICPVICDMPLPNHAIFLADSIRMTRTLVVWNLIRCYIHALFVCATKLFGRFVVVDTTHCQLNDRHLGSRCYRRMRTMLSATNCRSTRHPCPAESKHALDLNP